MSVELLKLARNYLVDQLKQQNKRSESRHPWRRDWEFTVLHSLRVEANVLKILAVEEHALTIREVFLIRLAAILHDIARMENREDHAKLGAGIARQWLAALPGEPLAKSEIERVTQMIAGHSDKARREQDYCLAVLKDADILDEIGAISIMMGANWLDPNSGYFLYDLRKRLVEFEVPFCDAEINRLNTTGARQILAGKKAFIESFITQLTAELQIDPQAGQILPGLT